jgi:acyl carrier protein
VIRTPMTPPSVESRIRQVLSEITLSASPLNAPAGAALDEVGVDSVGMIDLVYQLEDCFSIQISDADVTPENFGSVASLVAMVKRRCSS